MKSSTDWTWFISPCHISHLLYRGKPPLTTHRGCWGTVVHDSSLLPALQTNTVGVYGCHWKVWSCGTNSSCSSDGLPGPFHSTCCSPASASLVCVLPTARTRLGRDESHRLAGRAGCCRTRSPLLGYCTRCLLEEGHRLQGS